MVVYDLYFKSVSVPPYETHAVLIAYPNAVLSGAVPAKCFQMISRRHFQIVERDRGVQNRQLLERSSFQIRGKPSALTPPPQLFRFLVPEADDHFFSMLTRRDTIVKQ
jgi:hypothetical protein